MKQDYLVLKNLVKIFGSGKDTVIAVNNVNLEVKEGELVTLLGPSGCGKTTALRMISGFELPTSGQIFIDGEEVTTTPPNQRPTTMVFQNYALFPHMTVYQNIAYGLKIHREKEKNIRERTETIMNLVGLKGLNNRSPAQLSGGQQQRVSLARSLIMEPKVLLLDEPLSNLDAKLRVSTRLEIRKLQKRIGITSIYVTHDQEEAMTLSDQVVIMNAGKIQQIGTPQEIYAHPINYFVADFIGKANFLGGKVANIVSQNEIEVAIKGVKYKVYISRNTFSEGDRILLIIRPESVELEPKKSDAITGIISQVIYLGSRMVYEIEVDKNLLTVEITNPQEHKIYSKGEEVSVILKEKSLHIIPYEEIKK
ncbi:MAG: ABC transporter ATP-binding protein [bacterium]|nr:ABC transporter ATP-binding protein [bacterium]MBU2439935.1 ABC transporter ATP-binding protein [bacterium]